MPDAQLQVAQLGAPERLGLQTGIDERQHRTEIV